jgi:hypothetical protein
MQFGTSGQAEAGRWDASGNLLVGKTTSAFGTSGVEASASSGIWSTRSGFPPASFNRLTNDGSIAAFYKDGTTVGEIGSASSGGVFDISGAANDVRITGGNASYWITTNAFYAGNTASRDLGTSSYVWKDLHLSGGVYLGGSGSANHLDSYEEGTWVGTLTGDTTAPTTAVTATGTYTKIGRLVEIEIRFVNKDTTGASGDMKITGLPFTTAEGSVPCIPMLYGIDYTGGANIVGNVEVSGIWFYNIIDNGAWSTLPITAGAAKYVYVSATYRV